MERTHKLSKIAAVVIALAALVILLLWMQGLLGGGKIEPGEVPYVTRGLKEPYRVEEVKKTTHPSFEEAVGTVKARREVLISPRIMGTIVELPVKAGDAVKRDLLLARLDDRDIKARLGQARSAAGAAESEFQRASSDYERYKRLRSQQAATQQQFESIEAAYLAAKARLAQASELVQEAQITLGYTVIRSPIDGLVVEKHMQVGDMASPGQPIMTLQEQGPLRLEAAVREGVAGSIETGDQLKVRIDALDLELAGTVEEKVPAADPMTRSFLVKVSLPQRPGLRSGMFGRIYVPVGSASVLTVPRTAIQRVGELDLVWVLSEQRPERRYVRTGYEYGDRIEVLSGLREGEKVILPSASSGEGAPGPSKEGRPATQLMRYTPESIPQGLGLSGLGLRGSPGLVRPAAYVREARG